MATSNSQLTLILPTDLNLLSVARAFVEAVCQAAGIDEDSTHAIVLATNEAVSNVIRHAHSELPQAQIQIQCGLDTDGIEICLIDEGNPFDLEAVPHLDPAEIRIGGRGVFLMRTLMDELTCQPFGARGNILRMVKRCPRNFPHGPCESTA